MWSRKRKTPERGRPAFNRSIAPREAWATAGGKAD
jgi:hypothetical protein